ncbi:MAG: hypothetical protein VW683_15170 [Betaproteobacteria bacterium]
MRTLQQLKNDIEAVRSGQMTEEEFVQLYPRNEVEQLLQAGRATTGEMPGMLDRAAASFASSPAGEVDIYRNRGYDAFADQGNVMIRNNRGTFPADPPGLDRGDIPDMVGRAPSVFLAGLGGALGRSPLTAGAGAVIGSAIEQNTARALGSEQPEDPMGAIYTGVQDAAMEAAIPYLGRLFRGAFSGGGLSKQAQSIDEALGGNLAENLPASLQGNSSTVQGLETWLSNNPVTRGSYERKVRQPFEMASLDAFERLRREVGPLDVNRETVGQSGIEAIRRAVAARKEVIDQAYQDMRKAVPNNTPILPTNTLRALENIKSSYMYNPKFDLNDETRNLIEKLVSSAENIETFGDLNDLRQLVGRQLDNIESTARRTGIDAEFAQVYGALAQDAIDMAGDSFNTARTLARSDAEGRAASINRSQSIRDPDKVERLVPEIMSGSTTTQQVRRWKQQFGAMPTEEGLPAVIGGSGAWSRVQAQILEEIRNKSLKQGRERVETEAGDVYSALSGARMLSQIEKMGGPDKLKEIFGEDAGQTLFDLAAFLRNAESTLGAFDNPSGTAKNNELYRLANLLVTSPARLLGSLLMPLGMSAPFTNKTVRNTLTRGLAPDQNMLRALGRSAMYGGAAGFQSAQQDATAR